MCQKCGWSAVLDDIDDMIVEDRYQWALDTIDSIFEWVGTNKHITDKQMAALDNIRNATERRGR